MQRPVFYAIGIIITAYLPIFTLQRVEGRLFKPMAWTVAFALLGALLFSMLVAPVLASFFFPKGTREWHNPVMTWLTARYRSALRWAIRLRWLTVAGGVASLLLAIYLTVGGVIGSEFLPHLDEGSLWVRGTLAPSTGPTEGIRLANQARILLCSFPEATECTSQVGRPDDGTDTTGFFNTEYFVGLKPKEQWRPGFHQNKDEVIAAMNRELEKIPGVIWNFSQPIADNMEEAVSGVKGQLATKIYGDDLGVLEEKADQIVNIMRGVRGIQDLGVFRVLGQPNLNLTVDRRQAARYQINVADVQDAIQTAVGGNALTQVLAGRGALRPGDALSAAVPRHERRRSRTFACCRPPANGFRWRSSANRRARRRFRDLPRRQPAVYRGQVQRARTRPGRRGGGSDQEGERAGPTAARVSHRLGGRVREREARRRAPADHRAR